MAGWCSSWGNSKTGGSTKRGQGESTSGHSYLHHGTDTSNQNTNTQGGGSYGGEDWNFEYGKCREPQWSTNTGNEDWDFHSGRTTPTPIRWSNTGSSRSSSYQGNQGDWKSGASDCFGARGMNGKGSRGRERKRPQNSGSSDARSGKRRQLEKGRDNIQNNNYNRYGGYGNTGHDYSGYGGFSDTNSQGHGDWNQIPSLGSNLGGAGGGYDEDKAYNCQIDHGGGYKGDKKGQKRYRDKGRKAAAKKSQAIWRSKRDTGDDKLLFKKLRPTMQIKVERNSLEIAVQIVMKAMTSASETLSQEAHQTWEDVPVEAPNTEGDKNADEDLLPPQVLVGVIRVGQAIRKLSLKGNLVAELVAVYKNKPTKEQFRRLATLIEQNLKSPFVETVSIVLDEVVEKIIIKVEASECPYSITISCTSPKYCSEVKESSDTEPEGLLTAEKCMPGELLNEERCLEALTNIRRVRWSKQLIDDIELPIVRIFLDLASRLPGWKHLYSYPAEVLVHTVVKNLPKGKREFRITVSRAFTQCIEVLAKGLLLSGGPGLKDPCEKEPTDVFSYLTPQEAEDLTKAAQTALRLIACNRMKALLQMGSRRKRDKSCFTI